MFGISCHECLSIGVFAGAGVCAIVIVLFEFFNYAYAHYHNKKNDKCCDD